MTNKPRGGLTAGAWLRSARSRLAARPAPDEQEASSLAPQLLLAHVFNQTRSWVIAHPEAALDSGQLTKLEHLLAQFMDGVPLPYLLGQWEFFGLTFEVTPDVLIPRPETELLVEQALNWLARNPGRTRAADVGTGSGIIAACLANQRPELRVLAVDRSWQALQVARRNIQRHTAQGRVLLMQSNLLTATEGPFDLACANLPYIPSETLLGLAVSQYEPRAALDGGFDGLVLIRALLDDASRWLAPGGIILLEMQFDQGEAICALASERVPGARATVIPDLAGLPRLVKIQTNL